MPVLYADIIVDISAGNLDRVFQYKIPQRLRETVSIGSQVIIPFGKGNKAVKGFVVNITGHPDYDIEKIKEVSQVINSELAMESQLIRLAWQIKRVYGSTMNQALKTVIPVKRQVREKTSKYYRLTSDAQKLCAYINKIRNDKRYKVRLGILQALDHGDEGDDPVALERLLKDYPTAPSVLKTLEKDGIVEEISKTQYRSPLKQLLPAGEKITLNEDQLRIADEICKDKAHRVHLIHGVTGSGKTEVYMELIARTIKEGKQAIVLIPEISLSLQTVSRFYARFGEKVSIMNSRLSDGEKYDQYLRAKRGEIDIVIGPRSALFMPLERLGIIIIDEEHDGAYKSETIPRFHARDVAFWRVEMTDAQLVLGSATPSVESYARARSGLYSLHVLSSRARQGSYLPQVTVVDLREEFRMKNKKIFSRKLLQMIQETLARSEQILLFLNRRGYAGFVSCRSCGHVFKCRHCDISMTAHRGGWLKCHYCGYEQRLPQICPQCGSPYVAAFGTGTQKVERMIMEEFPFARVLRLDRDSTSKKDSMDEILRQFRNHEADILVGTQMIVKGHDFPDVTLVGILAADLSMFSCDYMAAERTFDLLTQAAGRSGRDDKPGRVVIQTYQPDHYSIECASRQDYCSFFDQEIAYRRMMHYPPVIHMLVVLVTGKNETHVGAYIQQLAAAVRAYCESTSIEGMTIIGPADASIARGNDIYRKVFYLKNKKIPCMIKAREFMEQHLKASAYVRDVSLQFDMNPMSIY